jgi:hypothetical protein
MKSIMGRRFSFSTIQQWTKGPNRKQDLFNTGKAVSGNG